MKTYVYKIEHYKPTVTDGFLVKKIDNNDEAFSAWLNERGAEGWLLVRANWAEDDYYSCIFVREQPLGLR